MCRTRIFSQKLVECLGGRSGIAQLIFFQLPHPEHGFLRVLATRIVVQQEAIRIHGRLRIGAPKAVAHLGVQLAQRHQRLGNLRGMGRDEPYATVGRHDLLVVGQSSLGRRLEVQRLALIFCACELVSRGLALGVGNVRLSGTFRADRGNQRKKATAENGDYT